MKRYYWNNYGMNETNNVVKGPWLKDGDIYNVLKKYGWHLKTCPSYKYICAPCDCGFEEILKEFEWGIK